jgi:hypothetical protein
LVVVAALGSVLLAGCTSSDGGATPPTDAASEDEAAADGAGDEGPRGSLRLTGWVQEHPRMVAVALRGVEVDAAGHLLLEVEAVNRGFRGRSAASLADVGVRVRDDLGNTYAFQRPEEHRTLRFVADERLMGTLAFEGPIDPDARYLEVGFNQSRDTSVPASEDGISQYPRFLFEQVPLPGVGLEDEADRGSSGSLIDEATVEIDQVADIPWLDGLEVTLVRYVVGGGVVTFELEAVNGTRRAVQLATDSPRMDDGRGSTFVREQDTSDDRDERVIRMEPGEASSATISFRGTIAPDAEALELRLNGNMRSSESDSSPFVQFADLPLPD